MKGWKYVKLILRRMNFVAGYLKDMPAPDFNVRIVYYEK